MSHRKSGIKPPFTERIGVPSVTKDKNGSAILWCPFCKPSHPLRADNKSTCGTVMQIRAVQVVYKAKYDNKLVCVKCGHGGGEMVRFQTSFIHTHDCSPGVATFTEPPNYSMLAKLLYKLPVRARTLLERTTGKIVPVEEVTEIGEKTGKIFGYIFNRPKKKKREIVEE